MDDLIELAKEIQPTGTAKEHTGLAINCFTHVLWDVQTLSFDLRENTKDVLLAYIKTRLDNWLQ